MVVWQFQQFFLLLFDNRLIDQFFNLTFWIVGALGGRNSSWVESFGESWKWSGSGVMVLSKSSVDIAVWIVGAGVR